METKTFRLVADSANGFMGISFYKSLLDDFVEDAIIGYEKDGIVGMNGDDFAFDMVSFRNDVGKKWCEGYEDCFDNIVSPKSVFVKFMGMERKCDYAYCDYSINFEITLPALVIEDIIENLITNKRIAVAIKREFVCDETHDSFLSSDNMLWAEFIKTYVESGEDKTPHNNIETYIAYAIHYWLTYKYRINVSDYMWDYIADYMEFGNYVSLTENGKEKTDGK